MRFEDRVLFKDIAKIAIVLLLAIVLCRVTKGYFSVVLAMLGVGWAFTQKFGKALACFALFRF